MDRKKTQNRHSPFSKIVKHGWIFVLPAAFAGVIGFYLSGVLYFLAMIPMSIVAVIGYRFHVALLKQKTEELYKAGRVHLSTVEALAAAIDARDQIGTGHVQRTQIYAVGLGKVMGLDESEVRALRMGALLHDIGKLGVPDYILSKPEKLTPAEREKANTHATIGASILEKVNFEEPVVPTVKFHHERWDGKGYPTGLAGEDIPITARILAVADTYDTLRSARPYRQALSHEEAKKVLANDAGKRYDPKIVQIFLKNLPDFEAELDKRSLGYLANQLKDDVGSTPSFVEKIKLANREAVTLFELTKEFNASDTTIHLLSQFTKRIRDFVSFDTCVIYLMDDDRRQAYAVHVVGENAIAFESKRIRIGEGATGVSLKKREALINVNPDLDFTAAQLDLVREYRTMAALPLIADDVLIGAVSLYSSAVAIYTEEDVRPLKTVAEIAAKAIDKLQEHAEAKAHAMTDAMTGLPNARSLYIQFEKEVARADRGDSRFKLLMLDLDGFKAVNDNFGHKVGDRLLRDIGNVISGQLREYDFLARYAGDEFVAIVPTEGNGIDELCSRIETAVSGYRLNIDDKRFASVGVSIGVATYNGNGASFDEILIEADKEMYRRKAYRKAASAVDVIGDDSLIIDADMDTIEEEIIGQEVDALIVELDERHVIASHSVH